MKSLGATVLAIAALTTACGTTTPITQTGITTTAPTSDTETNQTTTTESTAASTDDDSSSDFPSVYTEAEMREMLELDPIPQDVHDQAIAEFTELIDQLPDTPTLTWDFYDSEGIVSTGRASVDYAVPDNQVDEIQQVVEFDQALNKAGFFAYDYICGIHQDPSPKYNGLDYEIQYQQEDGRLLLLAWGHTMLNFDGTESKEGSILMTYNHDGWPRTETESVVNNSRGGSEDCILGS